MSTQAWIGVDLDGTLAQYDGWVSPDHIGEPIEPMVRRIREWLGRGMTVKIFTARVFRDDDGAMARGIQDWLENTAGLPRLEVTNQKDYGMVELWDDRCIQVIPNTGQRADQK